MTTATEGRRRKPRRASSGRRPRRRTREEVLRVPSGGAELSPRRARPSFDPRGSPGGGDAGLEPSVALGPDALAPASRSRRDPETFIMRTARGTAGSDLSPNPRFQDPAQFSCTQVAPGDSCPVPTPSSLSWGPPLVTPRVPASWTRCLQHRFPAGEDEPTGC